MARQPREHKTTGEVYETFRRIGKVGGSTVRGLASAGKVFNVIVAQELLTKDQIKQAAEDAGVDLKVIDDAFESADQYRRELGIHEQNLSQSGSKKKANGKH